MDIEFALLLLVIGGIVGASLVVWAFYKLTDGEIFSAISSRGSRRDTDEPYEAGPIRHEPEQDSLF